MSDNYNGRKKERLALVVMVAVFHVFISAALVLPVFADGIQDHPQLRQQIMDNYQDRDQERITDRYEDCLQAGIPPETINPMVRNAVRAGVDARHLENMLGETLRAEQSGLPTGPVAAKAMEGLVKGVEPPRIITAMENVRRRMEVASREVDGLHGYNFSEGQRHRMIYDTAEAMASGMDEDHVHGIYTDLAGYSVDGISKAEMRRRTVAAVESMKYMSGYGVPSDRVAAVSGQMINHHYSTEDIAHTNEAFSMARTRSWNMGRFSRSVESYIEDGGSGNDMQHMNWNTYQGTHDSDVMGGGGMGGGSMGGSGGGMGGGGMGGGGMGGGGMH